MNNNILSQKSLSYSVNTTEGRKIFDSATLLKADIIYFKITYILYTRLKIWI